MQIIKNPTVFDSADINSIEGPDSSSYEQMINDFLSDIDIQVLCYKSDK